MADPRAELEELRRLDALESKVRAATVTSNPAEYDPNSPQFQDKYGPEGGFRAGVGSGMLRMTRGLGNLQGELYNAHPVMRGVGKMIGVEDWTPDVATTEKIREQDKIDQPLGRSLPGSLGQLVGQTATATAATYPLGGAGRLSSGGGVLTRTLGSPTARAVLEGAIAGAGAADPDEQMKGALLGGAVGGAAERVLKGAGRVVRGLVKKSEATEALQQLAGQQGEEIFVPISQAAGDQDLVTKLARIAYAEGLSLVPGVRGQLQKQSEKAAEKFRELAIKEATPEGVKLPGRPGHEVQESLASIRQGFDESYQATIKGHDYYIPKDLRSRLAAEIKTRAPDVDDESAEKAMMLVRGLFRRFSNEGPKIEGPGMYTVREELKKATEKAADYERPAYEAAQRVVDQIIEQRLRVQGVWKQFTDLEEPARHLVGLERATASARPNSGRFTPAQLARSAQDATQLDLAQLAGGALKGSPGGTSFAGRTLLGGAGIVGVGATAGPVAAGGALVVANLLATKTIQKALMGDTAAQKVISDLIEKNPKYADAIRSAMQNAAATSTGE